MVKNLPTNAGDMGLIPVLGRGPGEGNDNPLQYSCLEIPWTEEPDGLQTGGCKESDVTEHTHIPVRDMVPYPCGYQEDKQETSWTPIQSKQKI